MKYYRPELYALCKSNGIKGCSKMNKSELIEILRSKGLIEPEELKPKRTQQQIADEKHRIRGMRVNPRAVTLRDLKTGEIHDFPSTYKAAKFIGKNSGIIANYNGRDWKGKYHITLSEPEGQSKAQTEPGVQSEGQDLQHPEGCETVFEPLAGLPAEEIELIK